MQLVSWRSGRRAAGARLRPVSEPARLVVAVLLLALAPVGLAALVAVLYG